MRMSFCNDGPSFTRSRSKARRRANIETRTKQDAFAPGLNALDRTKPSTLLSRGDGRQQIVAPLPACGPRDFDSIDEVPKRSSVGGDRFAPSQLSSMTFPSMVSSQNYSSPTFSVSRVFSVRVGLMSWSRRGGSTTLVECRARGLLRRSLACPVGLERTAARLSESSMRWSSASRRCKVCGSVVGVAF